MNLHEYQAKQLFARYAIPTPKGEVADSPDGAVAAARNLGGAVWVVKAQVHAGGRGKAGGVKVANDLDTVRERRPDTLLLARHALAWGPTEQVLHSGAMREARLAAEAWSETAPPCRVAA